MQLSFDAVFYYVSDLDRAIAFYRDVLGFQLRSRDAVARFDINGILFEVVPTTDAGKLSGSGNARLCLKVKNIASAIAELHARNVPVDAPEPKSNGILASLRDPDGNEICLWQYSSVADMQGDEAAYSANL